MFISCSSRVHGVQHRELHESRVVAARGEHTAVITGEAGASHVGGERLGLSVASLEDGGGGRRGGG